jgi:hypothetical protein
VSEAKTTTPIYSKNEAADLIPLFDFVENKNFTKILKRF